MKISQGDGTIRPNIQMMIFSLIGRSLECRDHCRSPVWWCFIPGRKELHMFQCHGPFLSQNRRHFKMKIAMNWIYGILMYPQCPSLFGQTHMILQWSSCCTSFCVFLKLVFGLNPVWFARIQQNIHIANRTVPPLSCHFSPPGALVLGTCHQLIQNEWNDKTIHAIEQIHSKYMI